MSDLDADLAIFSRVDRNAPFLHFCIKHFFFLFVKLQLNGIVRETTEDRELQYINRMYAKNLLFCTIILLSIPGEKRHVCMFSPCLRGFSPDTQPMHFGVGRLDITSFHQKRH